MGLGAAVSRLMGAPRMMVPGPHPAVGVRSGRVPGSTPYTVFYPAAAPTEARPARWFRSGILTYLEGYVAKDRPRLAASPARRRLVRPFLWLFSRLLPVTYMEVPHLYEDAAPAALPGGTCPLLVFSHGLGATSEEHALLYTSWALNGYVVVALRHCDGSGTLVQLPEGDLWHRGPVLDPYDSGFRPRQVSQRADELHALRQFVLQPGSAFPEDLRRLIDPTRIVAAGFSYGAATAALTVTRHPADYSACLCLDGWFHVDLAFLKQPAVASFDFPKEVHDRQGGLPVPAMFWSSQEFVGKTGNDAATRALVGKAPASALALLPDTNHMNFIDLPCWLPVPLTRRLGMLGAADPIATYRSLVQDSLRFLDRTLLAPTALSDDR